MVVSNGDFLSVSGFQFKPVDLEEHAECKARSWIPILLLYLSHLQRSEFWFKFVFVKKCWFWRQHLSETLAACKQNLLAFKIQIKALNFSWLGMLNWFSASRLLKQCCAQTFCRFMQQKSSSVLEELQPAVRRLICLQSTWLCKTS